MLMTEGAELSPIRKKHEEGRFTRMRTTTDQLLQGQIDCEVPVSLGTTSDVVGQTYAFERVLA